MSKRPEWKSLFGAAAHKNKKMFRILRKSVQAGIPAVRRNMGGHGGDAAHSNGIGGRAQLFPEGNTGQQSGWEGITYAVYAISFALVAVGTNIKELDSFKMWATDEAKVRMQRKEAGEDVEFGVFYHQNSAERPVYQMTAIDQQPELADN